MAIYGLDYNVVSPPASIVLSIILSLGVYRVGSFFLARLQVNRKDLEFWLAAQSPLVGAGMISAFTLPLALSGLFGRYIAGTLAGVLLLLGASQIFYAYKAIPKIKKALSSLFEDYQGFLITLFLLGYLLLAAGPITEADSLDYHIGAAVEILNDGGLPVHPEWFHSRLAGSGEVLVALGLSVGAEQFGAFIQFFGLFAVVAAFIFIRVDKTRDARLLGLAVVSSPLFIAWVSSPKPLLLPSAMTTSAIVFCHLYFREPPEDLEKRDLRVVFFISCLLCMTAATMKLNFMLSAAVVCFCACIFFSRSHEFSSMIKLALSLATLVVLPFMLWRGVTFGGGILDGFLEPFPGGWPGTDKFESILRSQEGTLLAFIKSLLYPDRLGSVTTSFGLVIFFLITIPMTVQSKSSWITLVSLVLSISALCLGQWSARFFIEPLYLLLFAYLFCHSSSRTFNFFERFILKRAIFLQALIVLCMVSVGVATSLPGAFQWHWRAEVMKKLANGYDVFTWVDSQLPPNAVLISTLRSIGLSPRKTISTDWVGYVDPESAGYGVYMREVSLKNPEFVLLTASKGTVPSPIFCAGEPLAGPFTTRPATRNPFNQIPESDVWIYKIKKSCLNKYKDSGPNRM